MESIIRDTIMDFFFANNFFSNKQFGFIRGRSTVLQLLQILDDWTLQLDLRKLKRIYVIYTDFEKVFDKAPHKRLISKLQSYSLNVHLIKWIQEFLCNSKKVTKLIHVIVSP